MDKLTDLLALTWDFTFSLLLAYAIMDYLQIDFQLPLFMLGYLTAAIIKFVFKNLTTKNTYGN